MNTNKQIIQLLYEDVIGCHEELEKSFGDNNKGVRDSGLIESAIYAPFSGFGDHDFYPSVIEKAACLFYGLNKNHGFVDGNKRTALHCTSIFLFINDLEINATQDELVEISTGIADSKQSKETDCEMLITWFEAHIVNINT
ncbi:hypothetical protein AB840_06515 [Megasphaera cerevisiae DSM 20462]|jgi:death-on-curing protein|uniref:Fido domain-containing protein n=1 Tax=Megasphaera cerevisiae DSM 20462 TaxID=1122219 RepID=A0A0J6ZPD8_9FIRM|nr:type II toxin-antitoxin system death-on-curing family toxin [Megasphaera cerevisiae]KMO86756.1 hypothetical protein AB840_06515 [Megasphaera cerevisiae DSM 20462]MCI1751209.1 type II toxin-antitoxin system death-on-curing family toxin [Megasphaera cerevisiae]SJZ92754.1 death on curing protein [Megasphaera cerevisiae DSM 20462]